MHYTISPVLVAFHRSSLSFFLRRFFNSPYAFLNRRFVSSLFEVRVEVGILFGFDLGVPVGWVVCGFPFELCVLFIVMDYTSPCHHVAAPG